MLSSRLHLALLLLASRVAWEYEALRCIAFRVSIFLTWNLPYFSTVRFLVPEKHTHCSSAHSSSLFLNFPIYLTFPE